MQNIKFDNLGPEKVLTLYFPKNNFKAFVVVHNTAMGPSMGGVRVSKSVTLEEVSRLAATMSFKNAAANLPYGGGKAGIVADPQDPNKENYIRAFAQSIKNLIEYIPGPDMGCNEEAMAWIYDEIGRAIGLPQEIGGIPLDELGATGYGLLASAKIATNFANIKLNNSRVAIHGFGSVGKAAANFLAQQGTTIVAVCDSHGAIYDPNGFDVQKLIQIKTDTGTIANHNKGKKISYEELLLTQCEILIPAAIPDIIHKNNADKISAKLILPGANIAVTLDAEKILYQRNIVSVPDFIANAGGIIMAVMEYLKKTKKTAFAEIELRIQENTKLTFEKSVKENILPREAAEKIAIERIKRAMSFRRY